MKKIMLFLELMDEIGMRYNFSANDEADILRKQLFVMWHM